MKNPQQLFQEHFNGLAAYENHELFPKQTFWFNLSGQCICGYDSNFKNIFIIRWSVWQDFIEELDIEYHQIKNLLSPMLNASFNIEKSKKQIMTSWGSQTINIINIEPVTMSDDQQFLIEDAFKSGRFIPVANPNT